MITLYSHPPQRAVGERCEKAGRRPTTFLRRPVQDESSKVDPEKILRAAFAEIAKRRRLYRRRWTCAKASQAGVSQSLRDLIIVILTVGGLSWCLLL